MEKYDMLRYGICTADMNVDSKPDDDINEAFDTLH